MARAFTGSSLGLFSWCWELSLRLSRLSSNNSHSPQAQVRNRKRRVQALEEKLGIDSSPEAIG
jgi:hypothetical protein